MKTLTPRIAAALVVSAIFALAALAAESLSVLLQKGIYAEETEGNLDSAIKIYEQISTDGATNAALIAQARYRLGVCYQKKGDNAKAVTVLNALLKQSGSDPVFTQQAQAKLAELGQVPPESVTLRKIPLPAGIPAAISPDGRFVASWEGEDGDVVVSDRVTGSTWKSVKSTAGVRGRGPTPVWYASFSRNGRQMAYELGGSLYVTENREGASARRIYESPTGKFIGGIAGWTKDGTSLVFLSFQYSAAATFCSVDVATGAAREIKQVSELRMPNARLSASGRHVTYDAAAIGRSGRGLQFLDLESGVEDILPGWEVAHVAGWTPDDGHVVFLSNRTGAMSLWAIGFAGGKLTGEPKLLQPNVGDVLLLGVGSGGEIYYREQNGRDSVYVATANFETGEVSGDVRRITERFRGSHAPDPVWSRDGQRLLLATQRGERRFIAVSLDSREEKDFPVANLFGASPIQSLAWGDDSGFALVQTVLTTENKSGIHRYDFAAGKAEPIILTETSKNWNCRPRLSPDGGSFYYVRREFSDEKQWRDVILRHDLRTGTEEAVYAPEEKLQIWWPFALSPKGNRLAVIHSDQFVNEDFVVAIKLVGLEGGAVEEIVRFAPKENVTSLGWSPDEKRLVFTKNEKIWSIDVQSKQTVQLKIDVPGLDSVVVHPDGRHLAFRSRRDRVLADELWVIEGLMPKLAPASSRVTTN